MTVHLLNSAVMPQPGFYELKGITADQFTEEVERAADGGILLHYIGYKSTLTLVEQMTGINMGELVFKKTIFEDGDIFLVIRLRYRVTPGEKIADNRNAISDFQFYKGSYAKAWKGN